jgi:hypothetical protein
VPRRLINRYRKNPIPAVSNIRDQKSEKSDTEISKRENKEKNDDDQLKLHAQIATTPSVVVVASSWPGDDDEPAEIVEKLTEKLKLSYDQSKTVQFYLDQDGKGYVLGKVALTRAKDLRNAGGFFIRALEKDYREPVTNAKPPRAKKSVSCLLLNFGDEVGFRNGRDSSFFFRALIPKVHLRRNRVWRLLIRSGFIAGAP